MKEKLTFEKALKRIEEIIQQLGMGEVPLDASLQLYAESAELLAYCNTTLAEAKLKVEQVFPLPLEEERDTDE